LRCKGKKANGDDHIITLYTASGVIASEVTGGLSKSLSRSQLELLGGDTELTVELKVKFNGSGTEDGATVFPLRTYRVILKAPASIEVGVSPTRHALSPDGAHLYVCIFEARKIVVVSTATYTVIRTIDSPEPTLGPTDISISPDGTRAYVFLTTNFVGGPHSVRILDLTTYSFTSGGASPFATSNDIALTKDGTQLYVGNARSISIYDSTNLSQIGTVPLIGLVDNNFITFSPDGTRGYYTSALGTGPSTVDVIDTVTYSVLRSIGLPNAYAASLTLSPDGSRAYVGYNPRYAGGSNICSVSVLDMTTERIITTLNIPDMSADGHSTFRVITSLDGTRAYLYGYRYRQIGVLNTATLTLMPSIPIPAELTGNGVYHITCSPTGAYLYASMAAGSQLGIIPIRS
jgi:DNA-binding beta-propeller fold protein YncE